MYQIDNSSAAAVIPASTTPGTPGYFTDGNPATGIAPTILPAEFMNMVMLEILGVLSAGGVTPSKSNFTQLTTAIRAVNKQSTILTDTGTANTYAAANTPALTALPATGYSQRINIANANTGTATYAPDGLAPKPIYGLGLQPLQGGELPVGIAVLMYLVQAGVNGGTGAWIIIESLGGASQVAPATKSQQAMQLGQATGRLMGLPQVFFASGTYTPTPGMTSVIFKVQGGGGAGAGLATPSAGNISLGAPGCSGSYAEGRFLAAAIGASQVVTVGAAGAAASNTAGGAGGTSSVGSLITAPGGPGGGLLNNQIPGASNGNGSLAGTPTGANIFQSIGTCPGLCTSLSASSAQSGAGGGSIFGNGGTPPIINGAGVAAQNYGAGGSGVVAGSGGANQAGGAGKIGIVIAYEYF